MGLLSWFDCWLGFQLCLVRHPGCRHIFLFTPTGFGIFLYPSLFAQDLRYKVQKLVAAKATLAARADALHSTPDGSIGDKFRSELEIKIDKLMEPPPVKTIKALPLPLEGQRKKRGGRRYVSLCLTSFSDLLPLSHSSPRLLFLSPLPLPFHPSPHHESCVSTFSSTVAEL